MNAETKYRYQKRIKELEEQVRILQLFRYVGIDIFRAACSASTDGKNMDSGWIAKQFERVFK